MSERPPSPSMPDWKSAEPPTDSKAPVASPQALQVIGKQSGDQGLLRAEARSLWREHRKLEMVATGITTPTAAFLVGFIVYLFSAAGVMPWGALCAGLGAALLSIPLTWAVIYSYYRFWEAPRSLGRKSRAALLLAQNELESEQRRRLRREDTYLRLEVDTEGHVSSTGQWTKSHVNLIIDDFVLPVGSGEPITGYFLKVNLRIRFHNPHTEDNTIRKLEVSLWRIADEGEVLIAPSQMTAQPDQGGGGSSRLLDNLSVRQSGTTQDYWLLNFFNLSRADRDDDTLFVKIMMDVFRQPLTTIRVHWDAEAARQGNASVTVEDATL